jgi:hypothetical protein
MRATEHAAQAAKLIIGFRPLIRNPHVRVEVSHVRIVHRKPVSKKAKLS